MGSPGELCLLLLLLLLLSPVEPVPCGVKVEEEEDAYTTLLLRITLSCGQNATAYRCAPGGTGQGACGPPSYSPLYLQFVEEEEEFSSSSAHWRRRRGV